MAVGPATDRPSHRVWPRQPGHYSGTYMRVTPPVWSHARHSGRSHWVAIRHRRCRRRPSRESSRSWKLARQGRRAPADSRGCWARRKGRRTPRPRDVLSADSGSRQEAGPRARARPAASTTWLDTPTAARAVSIRSGAAEVAAEEVGPALPDDPSQRVAVLAPRHQYRSLAHSRLEAPAHGARDAGHATRTYIWVGYRGRVRLVRALPEPQ
jgi:hypothetical protein